MSKKYISAVALVFAFLFILASCGKGSRYGTLITDEKGMTHVLATDANGNTIQDGNGNLVEIITDKNGKPVTVPEAYATNEDGSVVVSVEGGNYASQAITFPNVISNGKTVETADLVLPVPKGWEQTGTFSIILKHTDTGAMLDITNDVEDTVDNVVKGIEDMQSMITGEFKYDKQDTDISGYEAVKCHYDLGKTQRYIYVVSVNFNVYRFGCTVNTEDESKIDFEAIINNVQFR